MRNYTKEEIDYISSCCPIELRNIPISMFVNILVGQHKTFTVHVIQHNTSIVTVCCNNNIIVTKDSDLQVTQQDILDNGNFLGNNVEKYTKVLIASDKNHSMYVIKINGNLKKIITDKDNIIL